MSGREDLEMVGKKVVERRIEVLYQDVMTSDFNPEAVNMLKAICMLSVSRPRNIFRKTVLGKPFSMTTGGIAFQASCRLWSATGDLHQAKTLFG
jgi:hypothetical protein